MTYSIFPPRIHCVTACIIASRPDSLMRNSCMFSIMSRFAVAFCSSLFMYSISAVRPRSEREGNRPESTIALAFLYVSRLTRIMIS